MVIAPLGMKERRLVFGRVSELIEGDPGSWGALPRYKELIMGQPMVGLSLSDGNVKIGDGLMGFSLPAGNQFRAASCPGATKLCEQICYAGEGFAKLFHEWRYWVNWAFIQLWPDRFIEALSENPLSKVFRIHIGGDFYDRTYLGYWMEIIRNQPKTRFYAYTRSWQDGTGTVAKAFVKGLRELSGIGNMRLVLSCDRETGVPAPDLVPQAVRAWLSTDDADVPTEPVELVFRDDMKSVLSTMPPRTPRPEGTSVCPVERSPDYVKAAGKITCRNCGWCWGAAHEAYLGRPAELSKFSYYSGSDLPDRVVKMFNGFVPSGTRLSGSSKSPPATATEVCTCGTLALCGFCGYCIECLCHCDISFGLRLDGSR